MQRIIHLQRNKSINKIMNKKCHYFFQCLRFSSTEIDLSENRGRQSLLYVCGSNWSTHAHFIWNAFSFRAQMCTFCLPQFNSIIVRSNSGLLQVAFSLQKLSFLRFAVYVAGHVPEAFPRGSLPPSESCSRAWTFLEGYVWSLYGMFTWSYGTIALGRANRQPLLGETRIKDDGRVSSYVARSALRSISNL